jgi:hypothetical protein
VEIICNGGVKMISVKMRVHWIKSAIKRWYYKTFYKITIGWEDSMLPDVGKGKYVSVYRKGDYIDIVKESNKNFIRLVPYQPNHGVMVENWIDGKLRWRYHLGYEQLLSEIIYASNIEQLCNRNKAV